MRSGMFPPLVLTGAHVRLEPLGLGHVPALAAAASGARETYAYTWVPEGEEAMRRYVEEALALGEAGAAVPFATVQRATGRVIGSKLLMLTHAFESWRVVRVNLRTNARSRAAIERLGAKLDGILR